MIQNNFEHLRQPGVVGANTDTDINKMSFDKGKVVLMSSEIKPGMWDYGYSIECPENPKKGQIKLPGEGSGWFRSQEDAILYGLDVLRRKVHNREVKTELEAAIYARMQHSLDFGI